MKLPRIGSPSAEKRASSSTQEQVLVGLPLVLVQLRQIAQFERPLSCVAAHRSRAVRLCDQAQCGFAHFPPIPKWDGDAASRTIDEFFLPVTVIRHNG